MAFLLTFLAMGCAAEVGAPIAEGRGEPNAGPAWRYALHPSVRASADAELEEDPFHPERPECWPNADEVAFWREARDADTAEVRWSRVEGLYRTDGFGSTLEIHEDGRYEWWNGGCTGNTLELGFVDVYEDWVVLRTSECRFRREPLSRRTYLLRDTADDWTVLIDPDHDRKFAESPKLRDEGDEEGWFWEYSPK